MRLTASHFEITGTRTYGYQTYVDKALYMSLTQRDLDRYMYRDAVAKYHRSRGNTVPRTSGGQVG